MEIDISIKIIMEQMYVSVGASRSWNLLLGAVELQVDTFINRSLKNMYVQVGGPDLGICHWGT